jgi:hypothetical protein
MHINAIYNSVATSQKTHCVARTAIFWDITQCIMGIPYRRVGASHRSHLHVSIYLLGFLHLEDGADSLSRNVGKEFPLYAA